MVGDPGGGSNPGRRRDACPTYAERMTKRPVRGSQLAGEDNADETTAAALPPGELQFIERIRLRAAALPQPPELLLGIGDDCAILRPRPGEDIVVTTDFSLESRHFRRDWHPAASVGHRSLARGLSDIAAMGARPLAAFLSLALPAAMASKTAWLDGFLDGLLRLAQEHGVALAGGDTAQAPGTDILADIVVLGAAASGTALRRSGARPGDGLYCTGRLGGSAAELALLEADPQRFRSAARGAEAFPHLFPEPRLRVGEFLRERGLATSCMDLSDGLSTDLAHLCRASGVSAEVDFAALPVAENLLRADPAFRRHCMLDGGEDYELVFTAAADTVVPKLIAGVAVTRIGRIILQDAGQTAAVAAAESVPRIAAASLDAASVDVALVDAASVDPASVDAAQPRAPLVVLLRYPDGTTEPLAPGGWEHFRTV